MPAHRRMTMPFLPTRVAALAGLAALAVLFVWMFRLPATQLDDAYISYRYALNLAHGHGLVFNQGEYVEGFTNLLWTLLIAGGIVLGGDAPSLGHWLSVLFSAATLVTAYAYTRRLTGRQHPVLALLTPIGLLASNAFVCWTTAGLETPLFLWLSTLAALALLSRRPIVAACVCGLALLTRPEGALLAAALLGYDVLSVIKARRPRAARELACVAAPGLLFAAVLVALTLFRLWYYGDVVPNTFYAKAGGVPVWRGVIYLRNALVDGPALLRPGAAIAAIRLPAFRPACAFILLNAAYVVAIGGDVFPLGRFILPTLPLLLAGAVAGGTLLRPLWSRTALLTLPPLCILWSLYFTWPVGLGPPDYDFARSRPAPFPHPAKRMAARIHWIFNADEDAHRQQTLALIRALRPPVHVLATIGIGKLGYWASDMTILDMVGLTDRHIAHSGKTIAGTVIAPGHARTDSAYVLSRRPDVIELLRRGAILPPLPVILDMWANPDLDRLYHYVPGLNCYVRN